MKKIIVISIFFLFTSEVSNAQFYKSFLPSGAFSDSLALVVGDFTHNFMQIQGDSLSSGNEVGVFNSKLGIPGSISCIIYRSNSYYDTTASWQAIMYRGSKYKEAVKIYKNTFRLVKKSRLRWLDKVGMDFTGEMEEPSVDVGFAVSTLRPEFPEPHYIKFTAEIELVSSYEGWEVRLNLQNKRDDMEGKTGGPQ